MARVSHKKIKQLIAQKQSKITDRQFFTSRILANHFADIAAAQTRRYGYRRRVKCSIIWKPKNPSLACTDNALIQINAGNPQVTRQKGRQARYEQVCGLFGLSCIAVLSQFSRDRQVVPGESAPAKCCRARCGSGFVSLPESRSKECRPVGENIP